MIAINDYIAGYRRLFDNNLSSQELEGIQTFVKLVNDNYSRFTRYQWCYIFATVYHETAQTFQPVREAFWKTEEWRRRNFRYFPFYGRGYVQITWDYNYKKFGKLLTLPLFTNPDIAMNPETAFKICIEGFDKGLFTGKKISDTINISTKNYIGSRRIINGNDKAELIASYATKFEQLILE